MKSKSVDQHEVQAMVDSEKSKVSLCLIRSTLSHQANISGVATSMDDCRMTASL